MAKSSAAISRIFRSTKITLWNCKIICSHLTSFFVLHWSTEKFSIKKGVFYYGAKSSAFLIILLGLLLLLPSEQFCGHLLFSGCISCSPYGFTNSESWTLTNFRTNQSESCLFIYCCLFIKMIKTCSDRSKQLWQFGVQNR